MMRGLTEVDPLTINQHDHRVIMSPPLLERHMTPTMIRILIHIIIGMMQITLEHHTIITLRIQVFLDLRVFTNPYTIPLANQDQTRHQRGVARSEPKKEKECNRFRYI